jgi:hypothetical protein
VGEVRRLVTSFMLLILMGMPIFSLAFALGGIGPPEVVMSTLTTDHRHRHGERPRTLLVVRVSPQRACEQRSATPASSFCRW